MRKGLLLFGGTVVGAAGVLAYPTHAAKLSIPGAGGSQPTSPTQSQSTTPSQPTNPAQPTNPSQSTTPQTTPASAPSASAPTTRSATSNTVSFQYGDIAVNVTVSGTKITGIRIASIDETDGRSQSIDSYAVPQLEQQVIQAGSVNIDGVSGATFTSQAFVNAVANALQKLGIAS